MKDVFADHQMPHRAQDLTDYELTEEQEAGILAGLADLDAGAGITLADAIETIKRSLARSIHECRHEAFEAEARRGFSQVRPTEAYLQSVEVAE